MVPASFLEPWKQLLHSHRLEQADDLPNDFVDDIDSLVTTCVLRSLQLGTGLSVYRRVLLPAILTAKHSVHLVTCYWAPSPTLESLQQTLLQLVHDRSQSSRRLPPLRVSVGFSSSGLLQKLLHTSSPQGFVYPPSRWQSLGLPEEPDLRRAGIEMTVKSLFFTPFGVVHPKYVLIDEETAFLPSCNVSWERWLEGCVEVRGDLVQRLVTFHAQVWGPGDLKPTRVSTAVPREALERTALTEMDDAEVDGTISTSAVDLIENLATQSIQASLGRLVPTILLPSSHHRDPRFSFFPFLSQRHPPITPLNAALLTLVGNAQRRIEILTPNVTSWPLLDALFQALLRGVDVQIRTSKNMMLLEQLITAGTTTSWCLGRFIAKYQDASKRHSSDTEAQPVRLGGLEILYYRPLEWRREDEEEPIKNHFKMTMVDGEYLVLGSGNMDRASWWTSQELGVLFYVPGFKGHHMWDAVLHSRVETLFSSSGQARV